MGEKSNGSIGSAAHHLARWLAAPFCLLMLSQARANVLTWDITQGDGATITNGAGTWSNGGPNWNNGSGDATWNNVNGDTASFNTAGAGYTVSLGSDITAGGIIVSNNNNLNIGTSGETHTLTLTQDAVIDAERNTQIFASVAGSDFTITSAHARQITLKTTNSYTGTLSIQNQARVAFTLATGLPSAASIKFLNNAGTGQQASWLFMSTDLTAAGLSSEGGNGGNIRNNDTSGTHTLTINPDNAASPVDSTYGGTILDNSAALTALTKAGSHTLTLTGVNAYTGNTTVSGGTLSLASGGELRFKIQDGDVSNQILGAGTIDLDGLLRLDTSGLTDTAGTWNLVDVADLTESFGANFGLAFVGGPSFTNGGSGIYTSGDWSFDTSNGNLTLAVPEPASLGLLTAMAAGLLARRRRRPIAER